MPSRSHGLPKASKETLPRDLLDPLRGMGLVGGDETPPATQLPGGVSSDIWRVDTAIGPICVKRALPALKVEADWRVPVERNAYEVRYLETTRKIVRGAVPRVLGHDEEAGLFAMEYLDPARYRLWKAELAAGRADPAAAAAVGDRLGRIHQATADSSELASTFATDRLFDAIRLEAYLDETARVHPDLAEILRELKVVTASTRRVLVHGDVSPKNILIGPDGPVFLDAECAWFGDPAFDVGFCLNHLMLKCVWVPESAAAFLDSFGSLLEAYEAHVTWESWMGLSARIARLLPALFLARIDGKSPVEYIVQESDKDLVRRVARGLLRAPVDRPAEVRLAWARALGIA